MKRIYKTYLHIPAKGKVSETVVKVKILLSVLAILLCISATAITAYAYFSDSAAAAVGTIQAAKYELNVSIDGEEIDLSKSQLLEAGQHLVAIQKMNDEETSASGIGSTTGFCVIMVKDGDTYHTQQIDTISESDGKESMTFTLEITGEAIQITLLPHWGTSSYYAAYQEAQEFYIQDGDCIKIQGMMADMEEENEEISSEEEPESIEFDWAESQPEEMEESSGDAKNFVVEESSAVQEEVANDGESEGETLEEIEEQSSEDLAEQESSTAEDMVEDGTT